MSQNLGSFSILVGCSKALNQIFPTINSFILLAFSLVSSWNGINELVKVWIAKECCSFVNYGYVFEGPRTYRQSIWRGKCHCHRFPARVLAEAQPHDGLCS